MQHILTVLRPGGRAAVVLPDNCLFADQAGEVFKILCEDCDLHTVLRLPRGTFTPYSQGVKANVDLLHQGQADRDRLDLRRPHQRPRHHQEGPPAHRSPLRRIREMLTARTRTASRSAPPDESTEDRWRCFPIGEVKQRDFKLDSFKWLKEESLEDADDLPEPEELAAEAMAELEGAVKELNRVLALLGNGGGR